ncbi:MAG: choice-of-anchor D domain-containing protein, partial [Bacteroidota bacterium]
MKKIFLIIAIFFAALNTQAKLNLLHPDGNETFVAGTDMLIEWEGSKPQDTITIYYSLDFGLSWIAITDTATGTEYLWENIPKPASENCRIKVTRKIKSADIIWDKSYGGSGTDELYAVTGTSANGLIIAGTTLSNDGDVSNPLSLWPNYWLVKIQDNGSIGWSYIIESTAQHSTYDVGLSQTSDGGCILASFEDINFSNKEDYHVIKLSSTGNLEWEKHFGGTAYDHAFSVIQDNNNNYVIAGRYHGAYGIIKLNSSGNIIWEKLYGGTGFETANSIIQTNDGGYIVAGFSNSSDGDVSVNKGENDIWVVKISDAGVLQWERSYGGSQIDVAECIKQTSDGGYVIGGWTRSNDYDVSNQKGVQDCWLIRIDNSGNIIWEKTYGGSSSDGIKSIDLLPNGGVLVAGGTKSNDGDISNFKGVVDYWIFEVDNNGDLIWEKTLGGSGDDRAYYANKLNDGNFIAAGYSTSHDGDVSNPKGGADYWVIKLEPSFTIESDVSEGLFAIVAPEIEAKDIDLKDVCVDYGRDSLITSYILNPGTYKNRVDTIIISGADAEHFSCNESFPFEVMPGGEKAVEFSFYPGTPGKKSADVVIYSVADTITRQIKGEALECDLEITIDTIDFKRVWVDTSKDSLVKNIAVNPGNSNIDVTKIYVFGSDNSAFEIVEGGPIRLGPGTGVNLKLRFSPTEALNYSDSIFFEYDGPESPAVAYLLGEGVLSSMEIAKEIDFGPLCLGEKRDSTISAAIKNTGDTAVTINSITISGNSSFRLISGGEPGELKPDNSRDLRIEFTADSKGEIKDSIIVEYDGPGSPAVIYLYGEGLDPRLEIVKNSIGMGEVCLNQKEAQTVAVVRNTGDTPVYFTKIELNTNREFEIISGNDLTPLETGNTKEITLSFNPAEKGDFTDSLIIEYECMEEPAIIEIKGKGIKPELEITDITINMGQVLSGETRDSTILAVIKNIGETPIIIANIQELNPPFEILEGNNSTELNPGASLRMKFRFAPQSKGSFRDSIVIEYECMNEPATIYIEGEGILPGLNIAAKEINFGEICHNSTKDTTAVIIRNTGNSAIDILNIYLADNQKFEILSGSDLDKIQPGAEHSMSIRFNPVSEGDFRDSVIVEYDGEDSPAVIYLSGMAIKPEINISINEFNFGNICLGSSDSTVITLNNSGNSLINFTNIRIINNSFVIPGKTLQPLNSGESRDYKIIFNPTQPGEISGNLIIEYECMEEPQVVELTGTGINPSFTIINNNIDFG